MDEEFDDKVWDGGEPMDEEVSERFIFTYIIISYVQSEGGEEIVENPAEVLKECAAKFSTSDYIMEPGIFSQLKR